MKATQSKEEEKNRQSENKATGNSRKKIKAKQGENRKCQKYLTGKFIWNCTAADCEQPARYTTRTSFIGEEEKN